MLPFVQAQIFSVGGDYKMDINVYDIDVSPAKKVSETYLGADEGMH
ncbi:MAG: hypothetical protein BSOLF_0814 [Candidatus Carbobacillus altaicus]|uniref:Uncharacterized protein n=1 Tax=Candidatus Carbonibacillus altaicus TaxID=2163959 RepID=A0A2R6Y0B8_9BACL|nr:MAG: hypothetical protein BSOLF_0814 [Candidatus Carbobacillus altaicus]